MIGIVAYLLIGFLVGLLFGQFVTLGFRKRK